MGRFIGGRIAMEKGRVMVSSIMPKIRASVEGFGNRAYYKVKVSMSRHKE